MTLEEQRDYWEERYNIEAKKSKKLEQENRELKEKAFKGKYEDLSAMLVSAVRYALGRRTYIVDWICEVISNNLHLLSEKDKYVMMRDIKEQEKYGLGDNGDKNDWLRLFAILEKNI